VAQWQAPKPRGGYVSLLLLDDRQLIASVNGYTYCLDPRTGQQQWANDLPGFGTGVTSIAALGKHNPHDAVVAAASADAEASAAASAGTVAIVG
jgi:outer membrane protein assembly factor BamB